MKIIKDIIKSCGIGLVGVLFEIIHKKFGGFASGGRYSDAHTFDELLEMSSSFLLTFLIIFFACFFYFQLGGRKSKEEKKM